VLQLHEAQLIFDEDLDVVVVNLPLPDVLDLLGHPIFQFGEYPLLQLLLEHMDHHLLFEILPELLQHILLLLGYLILCFLLSGDRAKQERHRCVFRGFLLFCML